jgi:hypothetical protein
MKTKNNFCPTLPRAILGPTVLLLLMATVCQAQPIWLRKLPGAACCPGCGSPDDPLGPRFRGDSISAMFTDKSGAMSMALASQPKTNSAPARANALIGATVDAYAPPANAPREFLAVGGEKYLRVSFAQLSSFTCNVPADNTAAVSQVQAQVPEHIKTLNAKPVAVTGFMLPLKTEGGLTSEFLLLRNQSACCYGVMPKLTEWVIVRARGKGVKAIMDTPVTAVGALHVGAISEGGILAGIYKLDCDRIVNQGN